MLKKPFSAPMITEFGRFDQIVLGEGNPHCEDPQKGPAWYDGTQVLGCDSATDSITSPKNAPFCDAWHNCGSS